MKVSDVNLTIEADTSTAASLSIIMHCGDVMAVQTNHNIIDAINGEGHSLPASFY